MSEIPCKDCITFAICKSKCIEHYTDTKYISFLTLILRCSIYKDWFDKDVQKAKILTTEIFK